MRLPLPGQVRLLFTLFTLSGFTGLIYESLWSHYLRLFLGAAAFAQSFVLATFMGGMALGAWLASRWSARLPNLLAAYGWIEAAIGLAAFAFDPLFVALTQASLDHVLPALGSPDAVEAYKYALCALLILPQTVLLGMTFPLMSGAVIRRGPEASGHHLALLYFTNSIGAAAGALAAGFWLLAWLGLPGTMRFGGALNLALAASVLLLARGGEPRALTASPVAGAPAADHRAVRLLLAAAFITGAASFVYEIVWIRMLSLVLGSSFQAFELMLSAFITGLALGGLWARRHLDRLDNPLRFGGLIQLCMGLAALATLYVYHASFDWMEWALGALRREDAAYPLFNLFSHAIAFAVMLPATFLAGVTLPLFTHTLLRGGHGERAIGQIYAANTLGAIAGVLVAVHLLMPELGVKLALVLGAALDMLLGAWLLRVSGAPRQRAEGFVAIGIGLLAAALTVRAAVLDAERLSSGVFRYAQAQPQGQRVAFYRDGKTASVALRLSAGGIATITTNGKPDASVRLDPSRPPVEDEYTMTLLGALPLLLKPDAGRVASIGLGSGLTAEVLLSHRALATLDTVEIEPAIAAGARGFAPRVRRPFEDARSRVHYEDAKSYFARHGVRYDAIVSEPSNPWVNGVAGLFTTEFYRDIKRHLAPRGLLVQWLHYYEFDDRLLASVLGALAENFADFEIFEASRGDLIAVAVTAGRVPGLAELPQDQPQFLEQLARIGVTSREDLGVRRLGNRRHVAQLLAPLEAPVNSDYQPYVQLEAGRARFAMRSAGALVQTSLAPVPVNEMLAAVDPVFLNAPTNKEGSLRLAAQNHALGLQQALLEPAPDPSSVTDVEMRAALLVLKRPGALCGANTSPYTLEQLHLVAERTLAHLAPEKRRSLWIEPRWSGCSLQAMDANTRQHFELYAAVAGRDGMQMFERARRLLDQRRFDSLAWARFTLLAGMVGAHAAGRAEDAHHLWRDHGVALYRNAGIPPYAVYAANWKPDLR